METDPDENDTVADEEEEEHATPEELREKLRTERQRVEQLEEELR